MKRLIISFLAAVLLIPITDTQAQTSGGNSPYSRYGFGLLSDEAQGFNKGMSGVALGFKGPERLNFVNPASYAAIDSITLLFDVGISLYNNHITEGNKSVNTLNSTLDYISAGFRLRKNLGISLGIRPLSLVSYDFYVSEKQDDLDGSGEYYKTSNYKGDGGLRNAWLGLGWNICRQLALGVNGGFTWGSYSHNSSITFSNTNIHSIARLYKANINSYTVDAGLQYTFNINKKDEITLGATYGLGHNISSSATFISQRLNTSSVLEADTFRLKNAFEQPHKWGIGFAYCKDKKLTIGIDYTCQLWKGCRFPELKDNIQDNILYKSTDAFSNRHKIAAGVEYMPDPESYKVSDHICYRAGFSYANSYTKVNGNNGPDDYTVSAGVGIPLVNVFSNRSVLNIAVQWEHLTASSSNTIKEDYIKLCLGLSFNANWFNKWRIE